MIIGIDMKKNLHLNAIVAHMRKMKWGIAMMI